MKNKVLTCQLFLGRDNNIFSKMEVSNRMQLLKKMKASVLDKYEQK